MLVKCTVCKIEKEETEFPWEYKNKNVRKSRCSLCQKEYTKTYYKNNKKYYDDNTKKEDNNFHNIFMITY
jgi:hypothetical protein